MSNFICEVCGVAICDTPSGYITRCPHYPKGETQRMCNLKRGFLAFASEIQKAGGEKMQFPYFRVTSFHKTAKELDMWFKHFEEAGTPCALTCLDKNPHFRGAAYALWRIGKEHVPISTDANNEELSGEIVKECHGFSELAGRG